MKKAIFLALLACVPFTYAHADLDDCMQNVFCFVLLSPFSSSFFLSAAGAMDGKAEYLNEVNTEAAEYVAAGPDAVAPAYLQQAFSDIRNQLPAQSADLTDQDIAKILLKSSN